MEQTAQTLSKLRQLIEKRDFGGDGRIPPERTLAMELGVGRRSLRRALDVLEQEGRIYRHQGRGTFIDGMQAGERGPATGLAVTVALVAARAAGALESILDHTNPLEVIEVRLAIEPVMARLAAFRASQSDIKRLQILAAKTRAANDAESYEEADASFHRTIAQAARNALFLAVFDTMHASQRDAAWRRLGEHAHCYKRQSVYAGFHDAIYAAIAARNGEEAQSQMQRHLGDVQHYIHQHAFPAPSTAK
jgi:DNA-binding FadR family transcriptional regulator